MKNNNLLRFVGHVLIFLLILGLFLATKNMALLATLGLESANFYTLLCGPAFFFFALGIARSYSKPSYKELFIKTNLFLLLSFIFLTTLLAINGLYLGSCSQGAGLLPFLLAIIPPLLLNSAMGTLIAATLDKLIYKLTLGIAVYLAYLGLVTYTWVLNPTFRLLTHGSIIISSDLMQGAVLSAPLYAFRMATLCFALAIIWAGFRFLSSIRHMMFNMELQRPLSNALAVVLLILAGVFLSSSSQQALGKNHKQMDQEYTLRLEQDDIIVRADPKKTSIAQAKDILQEALYFKQHISKNLGPLKSGLSLTIWLHQDNQDKILYTGAQNVHFAVPRFRELHISDPSTPHSVLGHELAHIYVGEYSPNIFGVPSNYVLIPNMALTEGLAMVLSNELNSDFGLSMLEQAKALHQAGIVTDIQELFSINPRAFALNHPRSSYIYSGAFIDFYLSRFSEDLRPQKLIGLIKNSSFISKDLTYQDYQVLISDFNNLLKTDIAPYAINWAKNNFSSLGILGRDCKNTYEEQKAGFWQAVLNNDLKNIIKSSDLLPQDMRPKLLNQAIKALQSQGAHTQSLALINFSEPLLGPDNNSSLDELRLQKFNSLFQLGQTDHAHEILQKLDQKQLSAPQNRLIIIIDSLLSAHILTAARANLYSAGIAVLFAEGSHNLAANLDFSYYLGNEKASQNQILNQAYLMANYMYARIRMNDASYEVALSIVNSLLEHKDLLPRLISLECQMMQAKLWQKLLNYPEALQAFTNLINQDLSPAQVIEVQSAIQRLNFALLHQ